MAGKALADLVDAGRAMIVGMQGVAARYARSCQRELAKQPLTDDVAERRTALMPVADGPWESSSAAAPVEYPVFEAAKMPQKMPVPAELEQMSEIDEKCQSFPRDEGRQCLSTEVEY